MKLNLKFREVVLDSDEMDMEIGHLQNKKISYCFRGNRFLVQFLLRDQTDCFKKLLGSLIDQENQMAHNIIIKICSSYSVERVLTSFTGTIICRGVCVDVISAKYLLDV